MGFFNKILKGLGFEDDEEEVAPKPKKKEIKVKSKNDVTATYNLNKIEEDLEKSQEAKEPKEDQSQTSSTNMPFQLVRVSSQVDVQGVVKKIRDGQNVFVNLAALSSVDFTRSLDFLSGAVYALGLSLQKVDEKLFLVANGND